MAIEEVDASPEEFRAASTWLSSTPAAAGLPNEVKLELYGLFKYATTLAGPTGGRPGIFSMAARAKYDAWTTQYAKHQKKEAEGVGRARGRYVEIARGIGCTGEGLGHVEEDVDLENLSDDEPPSPKKSKGKETAPRGLGTHVSVMAGEDEEKESDRDGSSPLHDAILSDDVELARGILARDQSLINAKDGFGYTPLHLAADRGYAAITSFLLGAGADRDMKDEDDQTPLMLAEMTGRDEIAAILRR